MLRDLIKPLLEYLRTEINVEDLIPARDRVLCVRVAGEFTDHRPSGLYVVSADNENTVFYVVIRVGQDVEGVEEGDTVVGGRHVGLPLEFGGEMFRLIPREDVLAVVEP